MLLRFWGEGAVAEGERAGKCGLRQPEESREGLCVAGVWGRSLRV